MLIQLVIILKMAKTIDEILDKVKKLLEKAESLKKLGSLEEANTFIMNANRMLLEYNLEQADVENHEYTTDRKENQIGYEIVEYGKIKSDGVWETQLLNVLAHHNLCQHIRFKGESNKTTIVGLKHNIQITLYLYDVVRPILKRLSNESYNTTIADMKQVFAKMTKGCGTVSEAVLKIMVQTKIDPRALEDHIVAFDNTKLDKAVYGKYTLNLQKMGVPSRRKVFIRSFLNGAVVGLDYKLMKEKQPNEKLDALIVTNTQKIEDWISKNLGETTETEKKKKITDEIAYNQGIKTGMDMTLVKGVRNGDDVTKLLK